MHDFLAIKIASKLRLSPRFKRAKLSPSAEVPCDTQICFAKSLANGDAFGALTLI